MTELTCIICPRGCHLSVDDNLNVTGNSCPRGEAYAKAELTHPTRTLTSTIKVVGSSATRVPCKTSEPLDKNKIFLAMKEINAKVVKAPIRIGDILIKGVAGSDVNIIATKDID